MATALHHTISILVLPGTLVHGDGNVFRNKVINYFCFVVYKIEYCDLLMVRFNSIYSFVVIAKDLLR